MLKLQRIVLAALVLFMAATTSVPMVEAAPTSQALSFREVTTDLNDDGSERTDLDWLPTDNPEEPFLAVSREVLLSGGDVTCVGMTNSDRSEEIGVSLHFTGRQKETLTRVTGTHVGSRIALVLDGRVLIAPSVSDAVTGGEVMVTGNPSTFDPATLVDSIHRDAGVPLCPGG